MKAKKLYLDNGFPGDERDPFVDPDKGIVRFRYYKPNGWTDPFEVNIKDIDTMNLLAVTGLKSRGYDLDGIRANFWLLDFWKDHSKYPSPQHELCALLGDEYRFDPEEGHDLLGTIRRVLPRGFIGSP